jgi:hypothetical protein
VPTKIFVWYGDYKGDVKWGLENGYMALHPPPEDRVLGPLPSDGGKAKYGAWLMACLLLLPKKGDLSLYKNWRGICLLGVTSKVLSSVLVAFKGVVMKKFGLFSQVCSRWDRKTIGASSTNFVEHSKRNEHGL